MPARARPPPGALLLSLSLLLLLVVNGVHSALPPGAESLCEFELPTDAKCSLDATANGSCKIHMLPEGSCFERWPHCWDDRSFIETVDFTQDFHEETNTTDLNVYKYKGKRFLITTFRTEETWWQVDVPDGEHNVSITGLLGRLIGEPNITSTVFCEGCPPPRISYIPYKKLHKFEIFVSSPDEHSEDNISVFMASSNETDFSQKMCEHSNTSKSLIEAASGKTSETLLIEQVYSTEFCFLIRMSLPSSENDLRYRCSLQKDMTEPPDRSVQMSIGLPTWWVIGLAFLITCLVLGIVAPLAIHKAGFTGADKETSTRLLNGSQEKLDEHRDRVGPLNLETILSKKLEFLTYKEIYKTQINNQL